jgi:hypothetical protein
MSITKLFSTTVAATTSRLAPAKTLDLDGLLPYPPIIPIPCFEAHDSVPSPRKSRVIDMEGGDTQNPGSSFLAWSSGLSCSVCAISQSATAIRLDDIVLLISFHILLFLWS